MDILGVRPKWYTGWEHVARALRARGGGDKNSTRWVRSCYVGIMLRDLQTQPIIEAIPLVVYLSRYTPSRSYIGEVPKAAPICVARAWLQAPTGRTNWLCIDCITDDT